MSFVIRYKGYMLSVSAVPTAMTLVGCVVLLALGYWQLERLAWKTELNAQRQKALAMPAVPLPDNDALHARDDFAKIWAEGRFLHEKEMYVAARSRRGNIGYNVITPMLLRDGGGTLLVNRGWIPSGFKDPQTRSSSATEEPLVRVEGLLRFEAQPNMFVPDNDKEKNFWFYVDIEEMASYAGIDNSRLYYMDAYVDESAMHEGAYPMPNQTRILLVNHHAQYAFIWFSLALALLVIYVLYTLSKDAPGQGPSSQGGRF
ncbi:MAG: SURF1 family protein [Alphaproteobacteria bacterium GM7ARS4]|nr:SURF1 family protein [Alphaproteobacteria bacterium GM7ARS4]